MTIANDYLKGGGMFVASFSSEIESIPNGTAAGTLFTLIPPAGKRVMLTTLLSGRAGNLPGITVVSGADIIYNNATLTSPLFNSSTYSRAGFMVGGGFKTSGIASNIINVITAPYILGKVGETITVSSNINIGGELLYAYSFGK